jgi:dTDP-4-dehydrorhamnose reductase
MRWLLEIWEAARRARDRCVDIRAVTVWSLLGSFDWNCLLTQCHGYYEPGAFDLRGPKPRRTAIARLMSKLASGHKPDDPVLSSPGWWRRADRHSCKPLRLRGHKPVRHCGPDIRDTSPIVITGASGALAQAFAQTCALRGLRYLQLTREQMDIANVDSVETAMARYQPWAIINAAGYVRIDEAERDAQRCHRENTLGPCVLAMLCARHSIPLLTFSTDLVFDGRQRAPYVESDPVAPLSVYGWSKVNAEEGVLARHPEALVVRTSSFFGHTGLHDGIGTALRRLRQGRPVPATNDLTVTPTYVPDLVNICLDLLIDREHGIWHLTNGEALTWAEFTLRAATLARIDPRNLRACASADLKFAANRPAYSALGSSRSCLMPSLASALDRYLAPVDRPQDGTAVLCTGGDPRAIDRDVIRMV